jgi:GT2 family glycosyltransferase
VDLSVCVVTYNTRELLRECLASIYLHTEGIRFEVIVVDNGSSDGTIEMVRTQFPQTRLIGNDRNLYYTKANNQAIQVSQGRYVLILNSDTEAKSGSLRELTAFMDTRPRVGGVAPRQVSYEGKRLANARRFHTALSMILCCETIGWLFRNSGVVQRYLTIPNWDWQSARVIEVAEGSCFLVRRTALDEVGLFDERMLLYYTDDDLCQRLHRAGWPVMYYPGSEVVHGKHQTARRMGHVPTVEFRVRDQSVYCREYLTPWQAALVRLVTQLDLAALRIVENVRNRSRRQENGG